MVTITSAESNRAVIRYIPEVVWGTTPGSGNSQTMRITQSGLVASKNTKVSEELRADRMVPSIIEVGAMSGGDVDFEFSAGSNDVFFEHFLLGSWTKAMNFFQVKGAAVSITGVNTITIAGTDYVKWITAGQKLKLEGFLTRNNNTYVTVSGTPVFGSGNTTITVVETLVVEGSSAYTKVLDAADVIVYASTVTLTAGNTVSGGGANAFGALKVGQRVFIDGLGKETGTIVCSATDPAEGDVYTLYDNTNTVSFEIRTNSALVAAGNVWVPFSATPATLAASIAAAVMDQFRKQTLRITGVAVTDTVTLTNHNKLGGSITESSAGLTTTAFTGGSLTKSGIYTVNSVPTVDTFTTVETLSTDANAATLKVVVKGSHLRNPGDYTQIVKRSLSVETGFTDVSKYFRVDGLRVGSFSLNVKSGELVKGKFGLKGRATTTSDTSALANTVSYTVFDTTVTEVFNATSNVGTVYKNGVALTTALTDITFTGDANLREQRAVGAKFPAGIGYGRFNLKGQVDAYFQDFTLYNDFINHATVSLAFNMEDVDHNTYWFGLPAVKFTSDPISPEGIDKDVMEKLNFEAQRDPNLQTMMTIDRFSSVYPSVV